MKKTLIILTTLVLALILCMSASAAEEKVVIDNVVYELTEHKTYGQHYVVTDFFDDESLAETTTKINILDEIEGIEIIGINTNYNDSEDDYATPAYTQKYPSVKKIAIPGSVKYLSAFSFNFFPNVEKLCLPSELEVIGVGAFKGMESLKNITLPVGITNIASDTFYGCKSLEKVEGKITSVGARAFAGCEKLTSVDLLDSCKGFGEFSFSDTAVKKIVIYEEADINEVGIFNNCKYLEKIVFEDTGTGKRDYIVFDEAFLKCNAVKGVYIKTIPSKAISIGDFSLNQMPNLEKIYFAGSEKLWNKLVSEKDRQKLEEVGVDVVFYYRHTHSFTRSGNPTCTKGGKFTYSCECGDTQTVTLAKDPDNHSYGSWKVTKKATYAAAGVKQRTCKSCGDVQKATVKKLVLGEIENLTATVNGNDVVLNWAALEGATGYRVYLFDKEKGKNVKLASFKSKTTYTVTDLVADETYYFRIKPYNKTAGGTVTWGKSYMVSAEIV